MSFNINACKRLSIIAGITRENKQVTNIINEIVNNYITIIIHNLLDIIVFCGRKTITVDDIKFLCNIRNTPSIISSDNINFKSCIQQKDLILVNKSYNIYTLKKPFINLINNIIKDYLGQNNFRIGKNVHLILQNMTEHYIIEIMKKAHYFIMNERETLLPRDIELAVNLVPF